jgi:hypothetical protein
MATYFDSAEGGSMTKSKGIKKKPFEWLPHHDLMLSEKYPTTKKSEVAALIGCSVDQVLYRASILGLRTVAGVTHQGKMQSDETKEKKRQIMLESYKSGRRSSPTSETIEAMLEASRRPDVVAKRAKSAGDSMRGRPQKIDGLSGASETNARAKTYTAFDPSGHAHTFTNLSHFVRQNPWLFDPDDVVWSYGNESNPSCRAKVGLSSLFRQKKPSKSWKGWTAVSKTKKARSKTVRPK